MKDFIFKPQSIFDTQTDPHAFSEEECFTLIGQEDTVNQENYPVISVSQPDKVFAKRVSRKNGTTKYLVRLASNGKLYNPLSIYGVEQDKSFLNRVCRSDKKFKEVNQRAFEWYLNFLSTKNIAWLNNAEREME